MTIDTAAVYKEACRRIRTHGWTQGTWTGSNGEECLVQALGMAAGVTQKGDDTTNQLPKGVLLPLIKEIGLRPAAQTRLGFASALWEWNDKKSRTVEEVTALLQRVASQIEAEADPIYPPPDWSSDHIVKGHSTKELALTH